MATEAWHDLGPVPGGCTVCGTDGALTMGEVRVRPSLGERLRRDPVARPARLVTCRGCGWRWTVRSTDSPPSAVAAVAARTTVEPGLPEPEPRVVERRVDPPAPRDEQPTASAPVARSWQPDGYDLVATRTVLPVQRDRRALTARLR